MQFDFTSAFYTISLNSNTYIMNKKLSHITIVFLLFLLLGSSIAHGWSGLIATTGDILSTTKWNELVNKVLPIYSTGGISGNV